MTKDEMKVAIAEDLKWSPVAVRDANSMWFKPNEIHRLLERSTRLPNWSEDLNAMHEVEKELSKGNWPEYLHQLCTVICGDSDEPYNQDATSIWCMIKATAHQRAEAYLRVKGLWR